jgi:hypothetical protein
MSQQQYKRQRKEVEGKKRTKKRVKSREGER